MEQLLAALARLTDSIGLGVDVAVLLVVGYIVVSVAGPILIAAALGLLWCALRVAKWLDRRAKRRRSA